MEKVINTCWLSPSGEVFWCPGTHIAKAEDIIRDLYPNVNIEKVVAESFLEDLGWIKYVNHDWEPHIRSWILNPYKNLTKKQLDKMYELTGYLPPDE